MASIIERFDRDGHSIGFQAQVRRKGHPAMTKTFRTKREANAWVHDTEAEIARGADLSGRKEAERTTLAEAIERFRVEYFPRLREGTQRSYHYAAARLLESKLAPRFLSAIRGGDIVDYRNERLKKVAGNTVRIEMALLERLYNVARGPEWKMHGLVNPVEGVDRPANLTERDRRLVGDEERRLLEACKVEVSGNVWLRDVFIIALETAMRIGEILQMRWSWMAPDDYIVIPAKIAKSKRPRKVPMTYRAQSVIAALPSQREPDGLVFPARYDTLRQAWERARAAAGCPDLHIHDLRHEATTRLFEVHKMTMLEAQAVTGHSTAQMIKRYAHLDVRHIAAKMQGPSGTGLPEGQTDAV
jgi:integrase